MVPLTFFCDCTCWSIRLESVISLNMTSHTCNAASPNRIFRISIFRRWKAPPTSALGLGPRRDYPRTSRSKLPSVIASNRCASNTCSSRTNKSFES